MQLLLKAEWMKTHSFYTLKIHWVKDLKKKRCNDVFYDYCFHCYYFGLGYYNYYYDNYFLLILLVTFILRRKQLPSSPCKSAEGSSWK